jgi:16S rRNA pseudouridine516 synthase
MRLDKFIASVTDLSRTDAKRAIKLGDVLVEGSAVFDPQCDIAPTARVELAGQRLRTATPRYFMLNKPEGYVCAARDRRHSTVLDLLDEDNVEALHVAGRLDIDTTGLVLLTDDGQWSHRVTAPKSDCKKIYWLQTAEPIPTEAVTQFARGLFLHSEKQRLLPAHLDILDAHTARLTISEGKYHQVKRMFGAIGNAVVKLHREAIGPVALDPALGEGEYRALTATEIDAL